MALFITVSILIGYYLIVLAIIPVLLRTLTNIQDEIVRKIQHIGFASSVFIFTERCDTWWVAVSVMAVFSAVTFLALWLFEKTPYYTKYFVDRNTLGGEMKFSLLLAMGVFAILFTLFGGILPRGGYDLIVIAVMSWGIGDAIAALIGKYFGKRKLTTAGTDHNKTWLGSTAMSLSVSIVAFIMLWFYKDEAWWVALLTALVVAVVATAIEAYSKKGLDTLWIPLGVAIILYGFDWLWFLVFGG